MTAENLPHNLVNYFTELLMRLGQRCLDSLIAAMENKSLHIREVAIEALGKLGAIALEPLIAALNDQNYEVREKAVKHLRKIKDTRSIDPLIVAMKDLSEYVRYQAAMTLQEIGWEPSNQKEMITYLVALKKVVALASLGKPALRACISVLNPRTTVGREEL